MATLARLNVTPIKGTALQQVERVSLSDEGVRGNRRFHLIDARGRLFSGSVFGPLVRVESTFDAVSDMLACRFPDRSTVEGSGDALGAACQTDFYGRAVPGHHVEGPFAAAFSAFVGQPVSLIRTDRDGDGPDVFPLTMISSASVADLGRRGGYPGDLDPLRFRINVELDDCAPFEEDTWIGRPIRLGAATLRIVGRIPRCVVTTQDPRTGVHDWNTLKQIASFRPPMADRAGVPFGVYATVETAGDTTLGDLVSLLDS
ncbi:MAG: MOSC N-terminal beta barrel domain-containing protein [Actinomycetota bacterium]